MKKIASCEVNTNRTGNNFTLRHKNKASIIAFTEDPQFYKSCACKMRSEDPKEPTTSWHGIHGYISVTATFKFTHFQIKRKNISSKIIAKFL